VLTKVTAQQAGRTGRDLRLTVEGSDPDKNIVRLWVAVAGSSGPIGAFAGSAQGPVSLDQVTATDTSVIGVGTVVGALGQYPQISQVAVAIEDATNLRSALLTVPVDAQPVSLAGASCDATYVASRCPPSQGCRGTPATCQPGQAPTISRMAFLKTAGGPTTLIEGTEPEDDLASIRFEFQNAQGQSIMVDSNGDGTADLMSVSADATNLASGGVYFFRMQSGVGLETQMAKLAATPIDSAGHVGTTVTAAPTAVPVKGNGQTCDARGFDVCGATLACSPGVVGQTNVCKPAATLRTAHCQSAPVLAPTAAGAIALGQTGGQSLWDAPMGCSTNDPTGRPEGVVVIELTQPAGTLVLSTEGPGTNFDTVLYLLTGCPDTSAMALGCADDVAPGTPTSRLVLQNVPAGRYLAVVDSFGYGGGTFQLKATVQ
jgi:hypothetical protein